MEILEFPKQGKNVAMYRYLCQNMEPTIGDTLLQLLFTWTGNKCYPDSGLLSAETKVSQEDDEDLTAVVAFPLWHPQVLLDKPHEHTSILVVVMLWASHSQWMKSVGE